MLIESLAKAASKNHGLDLQPMQVHELLDALTQMQTQGALITHRLDVATRVIEVMLARHQPTGTLEVPAAELTSAERGFWMRHDRDTEIVTVGLGEPAKEITDAADYEVPLPVAVPEVQAGNGRANPAPGSQPPLPLDFDRAGVPTAVGVSPRDN